MKHVIKGENIKKLKGETFCANYPKIKCKFYFNSIRETSFEKIFKTRLS